MLRALFLALRMRSGIAVLALCCASLFSPSPGAAQTPLPPGATIPTSGGSPWTNQGTPWAPNGILPNYSTTSTVNWSSGTAAVGTLNYQNQSFGPTITYNLTSGSSYSQIPYRAYDNYTGSSGTAWEAPFNPVYSPSSTLSNTLTSLANSSSYYASNFSTANVSTYYPYGPDRNNPGGNIKPGGSSYANINNNTFYVGSKVTDISGSSTTTYPQTDPYYYSPPPNYVPLVLRNPATNVNPGTGAAIIAGNYWTDGSNNGTGITAAWRTRSQYEMLNTNGVLQNGAIDLASDVLQLTGIKNGSSQVQVPVVAGTNNNPNADQYVPDYVLQMDFSNEVETPGDQVGDLSSGLLYLGILGNAGGAQTQWVNAITDNVSTPISLIGKGFGGRTTTVASTTLPAVGEYAYNPSSPYGTAAHTTSMTPFIGSFQDFLNSTYVQGGVTHYFYEHSLDELRGSWGVDTSTDTAWAVLDVGNGIFAVVPEPATIRLMAACLLTAGIGVWWRRRSRIKASKAKATARADAKPIAYRAAA